MLTRTTMPGERAPESSSDLPRPPLRWQPSQEWALKSGPRPSRAVVDDGAATHGERKNEKPV